MPSPPARWPWLRTRRTDAQVDAPSELDAVDEHLRLTTGALSQTARWLAQPLDDRQGPASLVQALCDSLVGSSPHLRLAWVWFGPQETSVITPTAAAGPAIDYVRGLELPRNRLTRLGPAFRAVLGESPEPYRISAHSPFGPWRRLARDHGVRSVLALPLLSPDAATRGLMVLYADQDDYFQQIDLRLFRALAEVVGAVIVQRAQHLQLADAALRDRLTGLPNRAWATQKMEHLVADAQAVPLSVLLLDVDHFKVINDTWGHATGDRVLQRCADVLSRQLRHTDELARWGGEEFVLWLPRTAAAEARQIADKLRAAVEADSGLSVAGPEAAAARRLGVTVSVGVATSDEPAAPDALLRRADAAMYRAKAAGRNRVATD